MSTAILFTVLMHNPRNPNRSPRAVTLASAPAYERAAEALRKRGEQLCSDAARRKALWYGVTDPEDGRTCAHHDALANIVDETAAASPSWRATPLTTNGMWLLANALRELSPRNLCTSTRGNSVRAGDPVYNGRVYPVNACPRRECAPRWLLPCSPPLRSFPCGGMSAAEAAGEQRLWGIEQRRTQCAQGPWGRAVLWGRQPCERSCGARCTLAS